MPPRTWIRFAPAACVEAPVSTLLADGMACRVPDEEALAIIRREVDDIVAVSDDEVAEAMRIYFSDTHNVAEGAGAAPLAAALQQREALGRAQHRPGADRRQRRPRGVRARAGAGLTPVGRTQRRGARCARRRIGSSALYLQCAAMPHEHEFILTLSCRDTTGIVYAVSGLLYQGGCNIIDSQQFGDLQGEDATGLFFMRVHFAAPPHLASVAALHTLFAHTQAAVRHGVAAVRRGAAPARCC